MKYEEYKDSGMSWIGQVPTQWKRSRLKFLFSHSNAGVWGEEEKGDENDIACFRVADFDYQKGYLGFDKLTMRNITAKELEGRLLSQGSLLIEKSGGGDATPVGRVVRFNYEDKATCSNFVHFVTVDESHNSDFLYYYFYAMYANKENLLYFNQTTGIQNLKVGEYLGQSIFIPTYEEQQAIASYLDKKCGKINGAIDVQKKKIDLLNELKQTIITNAVTKGLNPNAPMKDSGVEWIGEVPTHWEVMKTSLAFLGIGSGTTPSTSRKEYYTEEDGLYWLQTGDLNDGEITDTSKKITSLAADECNLKFYPTDSVVIAMYGATIGKVGLLKISTSTNQACCVLPKSKRCIPAFAFYLFIGAKKQLLIDAMGGGQPNISQDIIKKLKVSIPPISEQRIIVDHIAVEVSKIDAQISKANRRIELLNELKQSIITEAVTGKIKVI
jgi:type I restriction enzyme S subunit